MKWIVPLLFSTAPALAEDAMTGAEFDSYTRGKTFYYNEDGTPYGGEEYLDGQRVRWSFLDGQCKEGTWYQDGRLICFVYEDDPAPSCWSFYRGAGGLIARLGDDPDKALLHEASRSDEPMLCLGPEVGV